MANFTASTLFILIVSMPLFVQSIPTGLLKKKSGRVLTNTLRRSLSRGRALQIDDLSEKSQGETMQLPYQTRTIKSKPKRVLQNNTALAVPNVQGPLNNVQNVANGVNQLQNQVTQQMGNGGLNQGYMQGGQGYNNGYGMSNQYNPYSNGYNQYGGYGNPGMGGNMRPPMGMGMQNRPQPSMANTLLTTGMGLLQNIDGDMIQDIGEGIQDIFESIFII